MHSIRRWLSAALVATFGITPLAGHAQLNRPHLNDTGLTLCADASDQWTDQCAGTGQDAEFGRDATHPGSADGAAGFSFVRVCNSGEWAGTGACPQRPKRGQGPNDWGCNHDRVTGLTWELKTNDGGPRDWRRVYTQRLPQDPRYGKPADAAGYVHAVNRHGGLCGIRHWRLPRLVELFSLIDGSVAYPGPAIDRMYFQDTQAGGYWSSDGGTLDTPDAARLAWFAHFGTGYVAPWERKAQFSVRLVSGALPGWDRGRFVVSADGLEVRDRVTTLVWRRCSEGQVFQGDTCIGTPTALDWHAALALARQAGGGYRMPNFKEMLSIVDTRLTGIAFDSHVFPGTPADTIYWTSTTHMFPDTASTSPIVWANAGDSGLSDHEFPLAVRLVRDAR